MMWYYTQTNNVLVVIEKVKIMKYKVTYKNGATQVGTMNTDFGNGKFLLNSMVADKGQWVWAHRLGMKSCFDVNTNDPFVISMEKILTFPELSR